jgi:hypothetical protein
VQMRRLDNNHIQIRSLSTNREPCFRSELVLVRWLPLVSFQKVCSACALRLCSRTLTLPYDVSNIGSHLERLHNTLQRAVPNMVRPGGHR